MMMQSREVKTEILTRERRIKTWRSNAEKWNKASKGDEGKTVLNMEVEEWI